MKFYDCRTAPSPRRVRMFLAEKGLDIETVQVDLGSGEQLGEAFRRLNPECVVPVLELDDGRRITEVLAICQYLAEKHDSPAYPKDLQKRADVIASAPLLVFLAIFLVYPTVHAVGMALTDGVTGDFPSLENFRLL